MLYVFIVIIIIIVMVSVMGKHFKDYYTISAPDVSILKLSVYISVTTSISSSLSASGPSSYSELLLPLSVHCHC